MYKPMYTTQRLLSYMSILQTNRRLKPDFKIMDQHTDKWLIHGTKHHKDKDLLQNPKLPCGIC